MEHILGLLDIQVAFNGSTVLDIDQLQFKQGQTYAIIGPSGAGKSTLLRVMNLLQKPTSGQITFDGNSVKYSGAERLKIQRCMSMVFQKPITFSGSVADNIGLGLKLRGNKSKHMKERVEKAMQMVGLTSYAHRSAATLSGGEAQRMALARAMVVEPRVLLLDEPTANLDPANVAVMEQIIGEVGAQGNTTIIIITHNLHQAKRVAGETVFLNRGKLIEQGETNNLFTNPSQPETKLFVSGEMIY